MDYRKKYEQALEKARKLLSCCIDDRDRRTKIYRVEDIESIFPDLRENDEERIVRCLLNYFNHVRYNGLDLKGTDVDEVIAWLEKQGEPKDKGEISDGYHTFNELYEYRKLYNAAFFNLLPKELVHKSKKHHDGEECFGGGWFIVMANLPTGQISNHYELKDWDLFKIPEKEVADEWDGHTPQEAADRLHKYLLEKQSEKVTNINGEDYGIDGLYHAIKILEGTVGKVTGYQSDDGILEHKAAINAVKELYKKQGGQEHFYDFNANDWYVSKVDGKIHNMTYNPADKIEPKFHEGDCVVSNQYGKVYTVGTAYYITGDNICLHDTNGNHLWTNKDDLNKNYHLWTIKDAKDGDILVCNINKAEIGGDIEKLPNITPTICIYQNVVKDSEYIHSYCSLYNESSLVLQNTMYYNTFVCNIQPATKEQRDTLERTMTNAGYKWDSEKKELKKIEPKTLDTDDILPSLGNSQVQDILEDMGMLDDNGYYPHTAEEIFKAGMEHAFNLNREAASSIKLDDKNR